MSDYALITNKLAFQSLNWLFIENCALPHRKERGARMASTMGLDIAYRRLRYRIGENHMSVKNGTRGLPIADCDIASARSIAHMCLKGSGADCDIADGFIASGIYHVVL
jgi:hypothetical protein